MSEDGWGLWGSWEETEACLDQVVGQWQGPDPVERGSIRRWLEPKEFNSAIHTDATAAQSAGFKDLVAPASMVFTYGVAAYWSPGDKSQSIDDEPTQIQIPVIFKVPAPCNKSFATSMEMVFEEPLYPGDVVTCTSRLIDINRKTLKVGSGAFLRQEDTYTKQTGEIVAVATLDIFRFYVGPDEVSHES
jgi:acyl dehydratase